MTAKEPGFWLDSAVETGLPGYLFRKAHSTGVAYRMVSLRAWIDETFGRFPAWLARLGIVDRLMGEEPFLLATPVMVTGIFALLLPIAFPALPAGFVVTLAGHSVSPGLGLGIAAVYGAIFVDLYAKAAVNTLRFASGRWQAVARAADVGTAPTD